MHRYADVFIIVFISAITASMATEPKIVCYLGSWANYRQGEGKFTIEDIDPSLCTHLNYGFAKLGSDNKITPFDSYLDLRENYGLGAYDRFNMLKAKNPKLKTLIAIGGWNEGSTKYSLMASSRNSRGIFIASCITFLKKYDFDGLDLDWEYPSNRGGMPLDKKNFVLLLKELKEAFKPHGFLLTAAVSAGKATIDTAYDIPGISKYLDFINLMAYDFHGSWESVTGHNAPLYAKDSDSASNQMLNVDFAVKYWLKKGTPAEKLILGMPLYGRSFTLQDASKHGLGAVTVGPGTAGSLTKEAGLLGYNEVCHMLKDGWTSVLDRDFKAPYAYKDRQWVGYDDVDSITLKVKYLKEIGLGGGMVWSLETDDFRGQCHGRKYPLLNAINEELLGTPSTATERDFSFTYSPSSRVASRSTTTSESTSRSRESEEDDSQTEETRENSTPSEEAVCTKSGYVRHPTNCKKFHYCESIRSGLFRIYNFDCAPGTVFSEKLQTCAFPHDVPECESDKR